LRPGDGVPFLGQFSQLGKPDLPTGLKFSQFGQRLLPGMILLHLPAELLVRFHGPAASPLELVVPDHGPFGRAFAGDADVEFDAGAVAVDQRRRTTSCLICGVPSSWQ
jgi:hypothetical protein